MSERPNLLNRLRGIYTIPVNDGAGPLNGSDTFTRAFPVAPIQGEAADEIERLRRIVMDCGLDPDAPIPPPKLHTLERKVEALTDERERLCAVLRKIADMPRTCDNWEIVKLAPKVAREALEVKPDA